MLAVGSSLALLATPAAAADGPAWSPPVSGSVAAAFEQPAHRYAPGHRGLDFSAAPGSPVLAPRAGVVAFAGLVADAGHVTLDHGSGLVSTLSFLSDVEVVVGQAVEGGAVIARSGGVGEGHEADVVHLGVRLHGRYVDPRPLLESLDLTEVVRLVADPTDVAIHIAEDPHDDLVDANYDQQRSGSLPDWMRADEWLARERERRRSTISRVGRGIVAVGRVARDLGETGLGAVVDAAEQTPALGGIVSSPRAVGEATLRWLRQDCVDAPSHDRAPVNYHDAMLVGGISSSSSSLRERSDLLDDLYADGQRHLFSYRPDGGEYSAADTLASIDASARALRDQLRRLRSERPTEIDLLAHSMGGVVVRHFLDVYWDPDDATLPRIARVVFVSSPLEGAPLAALADALTHGAFAPLASGAALLSSPAVEDLAPDSPVSLAARGWEPPPGVEAISIAVPTDFVVPATSNDDIEGVPHVPTHVGWDPVGAHSDALTSGAVVDRTATFVSGAGVPCAGLLEHVGGALGGSAATGLTGVAEVVASLDGRRGPG